MALEVLSFCTLKKDEKTLLIPMLDARRMEVYTAGFDLYLKDVFTVKAKIIDKNSYNELIKDHQLILFGNGASKCKKILTHKNFTYLDNVVPTAKYIGQLAYEKFNSSEFEDIAYFETLLFKRFYGNKTY